MPYVVIDPGHGGEDPGASGFGLYEKDVVLQISKKINNHFGQYEGVAVSLTRWDDRFISLVRQRSCRGLLHFDPQQRSRFFCTWL